VPGARPGELHIPKGAPPPRIRVVAYGPERLEEAEVAVEELAGWRTRAEVLWVDVHGFGDEAVLRRIGELFDVHPLALADVVNVPQRPKVEDYGDRHLILTWAALAGPEHEHELEQVSLILGPGFLLSFEERPEDVFDPVRVRLRTNAGVIRRMGPDFLTYALLDAIVDGYFPVVEAIGEEIARLEERVLERPSRGLLREIHASRRKLLLLHRLQWRQRDAFAAMLRDEPTPFTPPVRIYLRDVYDHEVQLLDSIETFRELSMGLFEIHLSQVSNRMNEVMKTLTIMASIFIPLTFVVGIYGMNFEYMPELRWRWGYFGVLGAMAAIAGGLFLWFRSRGWTEPENGIGRRRRRSRGEPR
jgi:magnesium transporter